MIVWYLILISQCICLKSTPVYHTFAKLPCFSQAAPAPNALKENLNLVEASRAWRMSWPTAHVAVVLQDQDEKVLGHCFPKWLSWRKIKLKFGGMDNQPLLKTWCFFNEGLRSVKQLLWETHMPWKNNIPWTIGKRSRLYAGFKDESSARFRFSLSNCAPGLYP